MAPLNEGHRASAGFPLNEGSQDWDVVVFYRVIALLGGADGHYKFCSNAHRENFLFFVVHSLLHRPPPSCNQSSTIWDQQQSSYYCKFQDAL